MSRFDSRYERNSIERGMQRDLQEPVGQTLDWYVFDAANTSWDPIYGVASSEVGLGRVWKTPVRIKVLSTQRGEGAAQIDNGLYTTDSMHIVCSIDSALQSALNMTATWRANLLDRIVFNGVVFSPQSIQIRGIVGDAYTVIGVDAKQVNKDEAVNDVFFQNFYP